MHHSRSASINWKSCLAWNCQEEGNWFENLDNSKYLVMTCKALQLKLDLSSLIYIYIYKFNKKIPQLIAISSMCNCVPFQTVFVKDLGHLKCLQQTFGYHSVTIFLWSHLLCVHLFLLFLDNPNLDINIVLLYIKFW